jgi:hypothetical protein
VGLTSPRLKQRARTLGVDLLLVDAGDRVDGNGLVDAEPRPVQDPPDAFRHLVLVQFMVPRRDDVVRDVGEQVENERFGDRFVVSNVNITSSSGTGTDRPYGNRVRK